LQFSVKKKVIVAILYPYRRCLNVKEEKKEQ